MAELERLTSVRPHIGESLERFSSKSESGATCAAPRGAGGRIRTTNQGLMSPLLYR